jgi:hypothetical protein
MADTTTTLVQSMGADILGLVTDIVTHDNFHTLSDGEKLLVHTIQLAKIELPAIVAAAKEMLQKIKEHLNVSKMKQHQ